MQGDVGLAFRDPLNQTVDVLLKVQNFRRPFGQLDVLFTRGRFKMLQGFLLLLDGRKQAGFFGLNFFEMF